jgi:hypothetical protein
MSTVCLITLDVQAAIHHWLIAQYVSYTKPYAPDPFSIQPSTSRKAGVSGSGIAFLTISYDEDIFTTASTPLHNWFRVRYPGDLVRISNRVLLKHLLILCKVPLMTENCVFNDLSNKKTKKDLNSIAKRFGQFAAR